MKLEIDIDTAEALVVPVLKRAIEQFEDYIDEYEAGSDRFIAVFDTDPKKDQKMIKKHIKSFKRVLAWYSVPGEDL